MWKETKLVALALTLYSALGNKLKNITLRRKTLRINCDRDCKTVWPEVLLCIKEDAHDSFYKEFHGRDVIYAHVTSFVMSLESCDPKMLPFGAKYMGFPAEIVIIRILVTHPYSFFVTLGNDFTTN